MSYALIKTVFDAHPVDPDHLTFKEACVDANGKSLFLVYRIDQRIYPEVFRAATPCLRLVEVPDGVRLP